MYYQRHEALPEAVWEAYRAFPAFWANFQSCDEVLESTRSSLTALGEKVAASLESGLGQAYFVDQRFDPYHDKGGELYLIVPIGHGFMSVRFRRGAQIGPGQQERDGQMLQGKLPHVPEFMHSAFRSLAMIGINFESPYIEMPDVDGFLGLDASTSTHLTDDLKGKVRERALGAFGERWKWKLNKIAAERNRNWTVFADFEDDAGRDLWVALDKGFKRVSRLIHPQPAFDAMLSHYLSGHPGSFDFNEYVEHNSIW